MSGGTAPYSSKVCAAYSMHHTLTLLVWAACLLMLSSLPLLGSASARQQHPSTMPSEKALLSHLTDAQLVEEIERRAFLFFVQQADSETGLVCDRARNTEGDVFPVASIAATGYGLAALPVGVKRGWITRAEAAGRARRTLHFLLEKMPHEHGWMYHFVDRKTGARVWKCEISSLDTALLTLGALVCGQFFRGTPAEADITDLAERLYARLDWEWIRTNGGAQPEKKTLSHGWAPEKGFLRFNYADYSEATLLYLLGMGAEKPLPPECWSAFTRETFVYNGLETLTGGPLFIHQMPFGYYDLRNQRDRLGYDYEISSRNATHIHAQFCADRGRKSTKRKTYTAGFWGLSASDGPKGYRAYAVPGPEDGTVSCTAALTSLSFTPDLSLSLVRKLYEEAQKEPAKSTAPLWGRYGFCNAFNLDPAWHDPDVIGIDLGMALLAIENRRSGLVWKLMAQHASTHRALSAADFHPIHEKSARVLRVFPGMPR
jgi:hypothetical protein